MDTEDGEFVICGSSGCAEDATFDTLVGQIEDFMISFDMDAAFRSLPSSATVTNDHERHNIFSEFKARVEAAMDEHVLETCPEIGDLTAIGELLQKRHDEISEEVWEFVSEGCFDYVTFDEQWKRIQP